MTDRYANIRRALAEFEGKNPAFHDILVARLARVCTPDTIRALLAERDALREDACVALVADIRFACGDNGKRMQPELVEFIRGLAVDAERYQVIRRKVCIIGGEFQILNLAPTYVAPDAAVELDAAIDQARGKENGNG